MFVGAHRLPAGRYASTAWRQRRCLAAPEDDALKGTTAASVTPPVVDSKAPTITQSDGPRSYPLEAMEAAAHRPQNSQIVLGGAVAVVMLGALASSLKLTFGSSREGTQPLLPTSQQPTSDSSSLYATSPPSGRPGEHAQQPWWSADAVYLVTEAPDPQDPASASPVLIRTTHGEVLAVFETEVAAAQLADKLRSWGHQLVTGVGEGAPSPAGSFRVAALQPRALNIQNVPPTVLIRDNQMTLGSLASPEAWQDLVTVAAPEQLRAWQKHVAKCQAPVISADATDVTAPANMEQQTQSEATSPPDVLQNHREEQASDPDDFTAQSVPEKGPDVEQDSMWRQQSLNTDSTELLNAAEGVVAAESAIANAMQKHPDSAQTASSSNSLGQNESRDGSQNGASRTAPEDDLLLEDMEPAVYASVEEMEEAERLSRGSDFVEEPLRLLTEEETDASLVHRNYTSLPVVFAPMLFRAAGANGASWGGDDGSGTERMLFTVDTTIHEGDPDIVALVFEDPVDASALLSMLAHVRGFRDPDAVTRRVVPMPASAAQDVASGQGASVLCMAKGFQKKAEVRAGKEIDGLLSRIAGARWASLIDAQMVS